MSRFFAAFTWFLLLTASVVPVLASAGTMEDPEIVDPADATSSTGDIVAAWLEYDPGLDYLFVTLRFPDPLPDPQDCQSRPDRPIAPSEYFEVHFQVADENGVLLTPAESDANFTWFRFVINRLCTYTTPAVGVPPSAQSSTFVNVGATNDNRTRFQSLGRTQHSIAGDQFRFNADPKAIRLPYNSFLPSYTIANLVVDTEFSGFAGSATYDRAPDIGFGRNLTLGTSPTVLKAEDGRGLRPARAMDAQSGEANGAPGVSTMFLLVLLTSAAWLTRRRR